MFCRCSVLCITHLPGCKNLSRPALMVNWRLLRVLVFLNIWRRLSDGFYARECEHFCLMSWCFLLLLSLCVFLARAISIHDCGNESEVYPAAQLRGRNNRDRNQTTKSGSPSNRRAAWGGKEMCWFALNMRIGFSEKEDVIHHKGRLIWPKRTFQRRKGHRFRALSTQRLKRFDASSLLTAKFTT